MPFIGRGSTGQSGAGPSGSRQGGRGPSTSGLASSRSAAPGAAAAEEGLTAEYALECAPTQRGEREACATACVV